MTFGTVENTVDYLCVEAFDEILQYASCWNQTEVTSSTTDCHVVQAEMISDLQSRSSQFNAADMRSQWCQILKNTTDCMSGAVDARCGHAPACIMRRMMGRALRGLASLMKCPKLPECSLEPPVTDTRDLSLEKGGQAAPESGPGNNARRCDWETREAGIVLLIVYLAFLLFVNVNAVFGTGLANRSTKNACSPSPCVHGSCFAGTSNNYLCVCDAHFTGQKCDTPICKLLPKIVSKATSLTTVQDCPPGNNWIDFGNSCYLIGDRNISWSDSQTYCQQHGGFLARIDTKAKNDYIKAYLNSYPAAADRNVVYWIGLNDIKTEGVYVWADTNTPATYIDWHPGQPESGADDCVVAAHYFNWEWGDYNCMTTESNQLCEIPKTTGGGVVG
ncbi:brevican core protein-like [Mya arenaria]|uniref:brevican core protein-like n=1 Tax=Mya arenaria TaxID=6604 RepID=UPI0022E51D9C|nr:brevican core protein-like [Mya arenaria]